MCYLHFPILPRADLGSSASNLPRHPKWGPRVESEVNGAETLCTKRTAGYSIKAGVIIIYFWDFQVVFSCFPSISLFFGCHDVKWRSDILMLRSTDIMTQVCLVNSYVGAQHIWNPADNSSWALHTKAILLPIPANPQSWTHLATRPFSNPGGFGLHPKDILDRNLVPILGHTPVQVGHVPYLLSP